MHESRYPSCVRYVPLRYGFDNMLTLSYRLDLKQDTIVVRLDLNVYKYHETMNIKDGCYMNKTITETG